MLITNCICLTNRLVDNFVSWWIFASRESQFVGSRMKISWRQAWCSCWCSESRCRSSYHCSCPRLPSPASTTTSTRVLLTEVSACLAWVWSNTCRSRLTWCHSSHPGSHRFPSHDSHEPSPDTQLELEIMKENLREAFSSKFLFWSKIKD